MSDQELPSAAPIRMATWAVSAKLPPELVEKEEHAGRQRQRAEEGRHAHAQRKLSGLQVAVDVESTGKACQQGGMVGAYGCGLRRVKLQHAFTFQARQFGLEHGDLVGALLRLAAKGGAHGRRLCRVCYDSALSFRLFATAMQ